MTEQVYVMTTGTRSKILAALGKLDPSRPWQITVAPYRKQRSEAANRRLWALHTLAAKVTGYSPDEMHEFALCRHFGHRDVKIGKLTMRFPLKRSSARNTKEFAEFMESTEAFYISDFGVWLP